MGGNISIGKPQNIVPSHGNDVSLDFIQTHWSKDITAFTVEPVMAETRPGVEKPDGGGASGPSMGVFFAVSCGLAFAFRKGSYQTGQSTTVGYSSGPVRVFRSIAVFRNFSVQYITR